MKIAPPHQGCRNQGVLNSQFLAVNPIQTGGGQIMPANYNWHP